MSEQYNDFFEKRYAEKIKRDKKWVPNEMKERFHETTKEQSKNNDCSTEIDNKEQ